MRVDLWGVEGVYNKELKNKFQIFLACVICLCLFWGMRKWNEGIIGRFFSIGYGLMFVGFVVRVIVELIRMI